MKIFALGLFTFLVCISLAICFLSFSTAFSQADTSRKDTTTVQLKRISLEKTEEYDAIKDSTAQNLDGFGRLNKKADAVIQTLKSATEDLKTSKSERDVQRIEKVYRIDTSPRPVVIYITNPYPVKPAPSKKGWFRRD